MSAWTSLDHARPIPETKSSPRDPGIVVLTTGANDLIHMSAGRRPEGAIRRNLQEAEPGLPPRARLDGMIAPSPRARRRRFSWRRFTPPTAGPSHRSVCRNGRMARHPRKATTSSHVAPSTILFTETCTVNWSRVLSPVLREHTTRAIRTTGISPTSKIHDRGYDAIRRLMLNVMAGLRAKRRPGGIADLFHAPPAYALGRGLYWNTGTETMRSNVRRLDTTPRAGVFGSTQPGCAPPERPPTAYNCWRGAARVPTGPSFSRPFATHSPTPFSRWERSRPRGGHWPSALAPMVMFNGTTLCRGRSQRLIEFRASHRALGSPEYPISRRPTRRSSSRPGAAAISCTTTPNVTCRNACACVTRRSPSLVPENAENPGHFRE